MMRGQPFHTGAVEINCAEDPPIGLSLLILHDGAGTWQFGSGLTGALSDRWHVYAPDVRGHGYLSGAATKERMRLSTPA